MNLDCIKFSKFTNKNDIIIKDGIHGTVKKIITIFSTN